MNISDYLVLRVALVVSIIALGGNNGTSAQEVVNQAVTEGESLISEETTTVAEASDEALEEDFDIHELQELVVESRRAVVEGNKIVVVPTKSEKKLSNSPASLIDQMQFPGLKVQNETISSLDGKSVAVFINGVRADNIDYQTFWPKNTIKVEYLVNSLDPTFEGEARVLNFIVAEPKTGGVTRLDARQTFPTDGFYTATSKLVTGNTTFGFNFTGRYLNDKASRKEGEESYSSLWYRDEYYDKITREYSSSNPWEDNIISTALNARYSKEKVYILHTIGFNWEERPDNSTSDQVWTPGIFDALSSRTQVTARTVTPQASGYYSVQTSKMLYLIGTWRYSYTDADRNSMYEQTGYDPIANASKEKVHAILVGLKPALVRQGKWMLQLHSVFDINLFNTRYSGTADTRQNMTRYDLTNSISFNFSLSPFVSCGVAPGVVVYHTEVAGISNSETKPTMNVGFSWMPGSRFSMSGGVSYNFVSTAAKELNPVLTQVSDLEWNMGNPDLKNQDLWYYSISGSYLASNAFTLSYDISYYNDRNQVLEIYTANPKEMGGVLRTFTNVPSSHKVMIQPDINLRLFHSRINLTLSPLYQYDRFSGMATPYRTLSQFTGRVRISTTIRSVGLSLSYRSRSRYILYGGYAKGKSPDDLNISVSYGTGDLFINAGVSNILHNRRKSTSEYLSPVYSYSRTSEMRGRQAWVNLTYFFGYGKKVDRSIDIETVSAGPTSVL